MAKISVGHALFKCTITAWVASVAENTDTSRVEALRWFYFAVNVGSVAGPLAAAGLRFRWGFSIAVWAAVAAMVLAWLLLRLAGLFSASRPTACARVAENPSSLNLRQLARVWIVIPLFVAAACQTTGVLLFWARDFTVCSFTGHAIPPEVFSAIPAALVLLLSPLLALVRPVLHRRGCEPSAPMQTAIGAGLGVVAYVIMLGAVIAASTGRVSPLWLLGCKLALTLGELLIIPASMAQLAELAQHRGAAMAQSALYLALSIGSVLAGVVAAKWNHWSPAGVFAVLALCCFIALTLTGVWRGRSGAGAAYAP